MAIPKSPEFLIPPENPFLNDKLERENVADSLTTLLSNVSLPYVLAINSPWGSGKTTFIKMWKNKLDMEGYNTLIYNAWENDFAEDPFISFMGEMDGEIETYSFAINNNEALKNKLKNSWNQTKNCGVILGKRLLPIAIRLGTSGILNPDESNLGLVEELAEKITGDFFEEYRKTKQNMGEFRNRFTSFVNNLHPGENSEKKPLIVFVDELDRSRPTFAIQLLERIKHLFNIPGIVFILALDIEQLGYSLKTIYGNEMDVGGYLRRFFDQEYHLPAPKKEDFIEYLLGYWKLDKYLTDWNKKRFRETFKPLSEYYNFHLRDIQRGIFYLYLFLLTLNDEERKVQWFPEIIAFLIILKIKNSFHYKQIRGYEISNDEIIAELQKNVPDLDQEKGSEWWVNLKIILTHWKSNLKEISDVGKNKSNSVRQSERIVGIDYEDEVLTQAVRCRLPLFNWHLEKFEFLENFSALFPATEETSQ